MPQVTPRQLAPIFVDLDDRMVLTAKVGPKGLSVPINMCGLIMFMHKRLGG